MTTPEELTAVDVNGHLVREYDDVALMHSAVFYRHDFVGDQSSQILTHIVPVGGEATIISISENEDTAAAKILQLEANDGNFFYFDLPKNIAFVRSRESKLSNA